MRRQVHLDLGVQVAGTESYEEVASGRREPPNLTHDTRQRSGRSSPSATSAHVPNIDADVANKNHPYCP